VELHRISKNDPRPGIDMRAFVGRTYNLNSIADYETGPGSEVSLKTALDAITDGKAFVDLMIERIGAS
jgi:hypothetical protein